MIIEEVQEDVSKGIEWFVIYYRDEPAGDLKAIALPKATFWIRSAEYDLDINDINAIVDIVISEFFAPEPSPENSLYYSSELSKARESLRSRAVQAKLSNRISTRKAGDPTDKIKNWLKANPPDVLEFAHVQNRVFDIRKVEARRVVNK